jgi:primosomal protein N' (replication factor Y) (superfamily II helicase)
VIARVVIIPAAGDAGPLDYAVDPAMNAAVRPGVRVLVPLGSRQAVGMITETADSSPHPRLRTILTVLDAQPLLDGTLLRLCHWMAEYYLCSFADALTTALPGSLRASVERVAHPLPAPSSASSDQPPALSGLEQEIRTFLEANGARKAAALVQQFGAGTLRALRRLEEKGLVRLEYRLAGGQGATKRMRYYQVSCSLGQDEVIEWHRRRPGQYAVYHYLLQHPLRRARAGELHTTFPNVSAKLAALIRSGVVSAVDEEVYRPVLSEDPDLRDHVVELTAAQRQAVDSVTPCIGTEFRTLFLWGVTGSGKTEVYLQSIAACLAAQRTAIVLVPEISLTHQLIDRVRARFGDRVAVLHSGLSDGERWDEWRRIASGEVPIVVGARSAVFAPLPRLGLVVVDEEHDGAYKQEDGVRYSGRDVAIMRAKLTGCPALLGSATPAIETFHNGVTGRYQLLSLPERVESRPLPSVTIVDLRRSPQGGKQLLLSVQLAAALKANLAAHGQSLVFLNRRGFANFLQCHACGEALKCPNCSVTLTLHRRWKALRCHHCDYTIPPPAACPDCGGLSLSAWGAGTEQVEAALRQVLPGARIGRMDRDTTSRKGSQRDILAAWERREYDILVGTQMITKGHDIPGVTLVGVLLADLSLNLPDFRAAERTFQLLTQVAGRAGRGSRPGRVIVQTLQPHHLSLQCAAHHDYRRFAEHELATRRELSYPPFARLVQIRCEGENGEATERIARAVAEHLRAGPKGVGILGPAPAPIERLRRRYRWQLLLRSRNGAAMRAAAAAAREAVRRQARGLDVRVIVDVDPTNML